jgi:cytoskeletal protein RodZ
MGNFGETLKRERELREISLREIADATKINIRYLEALEQNRFEILPGGVFNKGFIRAYARFIGANGDTFVDSYLQEMAARHGSSTGSMPVASTGSGPIQNRPEMLRPIEAPKRRMATPSVAPTGNGRPGSPNITFAEGPAAVPAAPGPTRRSAAITVPEPEPLSAPRPSSRALTVVMSLVGAAALALMALLVVRMAISRRAADLPPAGIPAATEAAPRTEEPQAPAEVAPPLPEAGTPDAPGSATPDGGTAEPGPRTEPPPAPSAAAPDLTTHRNSTPEPRLASPIPPPAPGVEAGAREAAPPSRPQGSMEVRIEAASPVWVQVSCDGEDRVNRSLQAGEGETLRCASLIRVSATDAGAVRLSVNGSRCLPIGDKGARVEGFIIRSDDVLAICPAGGAASDGRR